jgi:hypothetical protein
MKRLIGAFVFIALCGFQGYAKEGFAFIYRGSVLGILEDNGLEGDPMPLVPSAGFSLSFGLSPHFRFEPGIDAYFTYYGYSDKLERAVPVADENRSTAVYGFLLTLPVEYTYTSKRKIDYRVSLGITADLRLCLLAPGLDDDAQGRSDAQEQTSRVVSYFWESGRWLFPTAALGVDFPGSEKYYIGAEFRSWYPLYRHWTEEDLPAVENLRFALGVRLAYMSGR